MNDYMRDYGQDQELVKQFFRDYTYVNDDGEVAPKYRDILTKLANRETVHMPVELSDLEKFNDDLAKHVTNNTMRYTQIFHDAVDEILPLYKTKELEIKDVMDIFIEQRLFIAARNSRAQGPNQSTSNTTTSASQSNGTNDASGRTIVDKDGEYPPDLIRRFELSFKPTTFQPTPIREVRAEHIGKFVTVRGIVTRVTDVKPRITIVCYTCDQCGCETFQPVKNPEFTPLFECSSAACKATKTIGRITMQTRGSKFVKYQEIKLQEHSDQVPTGHIPRTITVNAYGELTRQCAPGDHISISGIFLPIEKSGYRMRTGGLTADTFIVAHFISQMNKTEDDELSIEPLSPDETVELTQGGGNFLQRLSNSIAPEIFGHENLKKALLLLLVGGVDRNAQGMKIRGNINICLMGDPGVAKSQLLGFIDRLAPRSQYTTGRGSSGVGLTAAVLKDPITGELALEGGALVLADQGICCIDEFDKMMDADRTAIHEVMEQQTVSIAKAGIMTTLNARVSILAAANPAYGRYNVHKSITDNLQLPPALLSRFDLLWLIKDKPEMQKDLSLAQHVTYVHQHPNEPVVTDSNAIDMRTMRRYINLCKTKNPIVPRDLTDRLVQVYLNIRARKRAGSREDALFTSPRSLLAIIRLATAFARLRLADEVEEADVAAAVDLYNCSRESIEGAVDLTTSACKEILNLLKELCGDSGEYSVSELIRIAQSRGFKPDDIRSALDTLIEVEAIDINGDDVVLIG